MPLKIDSTKIIWIFALSILGVSIFLFLADATLNYSLWLSNRDLRKFFNMTREDSLSNWISSLIQVSLAAVAILNAFVVSQLHLPRWKVWAWLGVGLLFFQLALDDGTKLHERMGSSLKVLIPWFPSFAWQITFGAVYGVAGLVMLGFLIHEFKSRDLLKFVWISMILIAISQGMDFCEGLEDLFYVPAGALLGVDSGALLHFSKTAEEMLEFWGFMFMGVALLSYFFGQLEKFTSLKGVKAS